MCASKWLFLICFSTYIFMGNETRAHNLTCGLDKSLSSKVYEGVADMETYPWMGMLYYPLGGKRFTTAIILITKQMVIASALEVDRLPKADFRRVARVVIGTNCNYEGLRVRDYSYHPEFGNNIFSAFAMVQLEDDSIADLTPICPPPEFFIEPEFYAMTVTDKCKTARIRIFKMEHVTLDECKDFYRRTDLDIKSFWPTHTVCARAIRGGKCMWRSGTALVVKQGKHWRLLGFGVYGPGCRDPARFMDYGMYHEWVYTSVARVGRTAITRIAPNQLVLRRKMSHLQRFGPCDTEETRIELFSDVVKILGENYNSRAIYNLSLYESFEYSCVVFRADNFEESYEPTKIDVSSKNKSKKVPPQMTNPQIYLRRWCSGPPALCYGFQFLEVHFYVEIFFRFSTKFTVKAYGKIAKIMDPAAVMVFRNKYFGVSPHIPTYEAVLAKLINTKNMRQHFWFYNEDYGRQMEEPPPAQIEEETEPPAPTFDGTPPKDEGYVTTTTTEAATEATTEDGGGVEAATEGGDPESQNEDKVNNDLETPETATDGRKWLLSNEDNKDIKSVEILETTTNFEGGFVPTEVILPPIRTTTKGSIQPIDKKKKQILTLETTTSRKWESSNKGKMENKKLQTLETTTNYKGEFVRTKVNIHPIRTTTERRIQSIVKKKRKKQKPINRRWQYHANNGPDQDDYDF